MCVNLSCGYTDFSCFYITNLVLAMQSESAQGDAAAMGGRGRGGAAFRGRGGRGMRRR